MAQLSDNAYCMIKPETTPGAAVIPTIIAPLVSESMKTLADISADRRMRGISWKGVDVVRGFRTHEGEIVVLADPDTLGHLLNMLMVKGSTTGNGTDGYTHPFTVGNGKSYTIDIKRGNYVQRFYGSYADEVKLDIENGQIKATLKVKAMGEFSIGSVGVALSGAVTSLTLDDEEDISPNRGLVIGDVINVGGVNVTLTSVNANGYQVGFTSTTITAAIGSPVYLVPQTVTQPVLSDPFYLGNLLAGFGATASASATAAASRSTATPIYDISIVVKNNLFAQNGSNYMDPVQIIPRTQEAQIALKQIFQSVAQRQAWQDRKKQAATFVFLGKYIKSDFSTQEKLTITFNNIKLITNDNEVKVGELIVDDQAYEALYDTTDGQAMAVTLINKTAGTSY